MRRFIVYFLVVLLAVILQSNFFSLIFPNQWCGNLVLMLVVVGTLMDGFEPFLGWTILAGVFFDLASFSFLGQSVIIFTLASYGVSFFSKRFAMEIRGSGLLWVVFFVIMSTLGERILMFWWQFGFTWSDKNFSNFFPWTSGIFCALVFNFLVFFGWLWLLRRLRKYLGVGPVK